MSERKKLDFGGLEERGGRRELDQLRDLSEDLGFPSREPASRPTPAPRGALGFRRPGRPPSDRMIAINVRVSNETAEVIYRLRDEKPRQSLADVIDMLVEFYVENADRR
ncbi:hypothetical protein FHS96_003452 [Sphingomonas zeicaulis]|uniref:hypothetical protein n=1 Tax=Sphingomonas zeicaulis TaxID=1632740 RepID=UPI003D25BFB3